MKKTIGLIAVAIFAVFGSVACQSDTQINTATVSELDLAKYMGKWYEIARFDHSFERDLVGCTAEYSVQDDGMIKVVNSGYKKTLDGKFEQAEGKAKRPNEAEPGKLKVSFFLNFYSDYFVMELADDYRYALIGSKSDKYLWILSRTAQMDSTDIDFLLNSAQKRGYNTAELIWVEQK